MFVTLRTTTGKIGGITGADTIYRDATRQAGLPGAGTYLAWISDGTLSPATRFHRSTGPYRRVDGVVIANNWSDFTDGALAEAPNVTEDSRWFWDGTGVWTHTAPDGTAVASTASCDNWTSDTLAAEFGSTLDYRGGSWTAQTSGAIAACNKDFRLYCFQQP